MWNTAPDTRPATAAPDTRPATAAPDIRPAAAADAAACARIYAPYVTASSITFEVEPPSAGQFATRIAECQATHQWLVATREATVIGYAYGHRFAERAAYDWSCETSIYLAQGVHRQGVGRALYERLLVELAAQGYRRAFAGITVPNESSTGLHRALGFEHAGCYRRVGWKHGGWHDVMWMQRDLQVAETDPPPNISAGSRPAQPRPAQR
jgi:L-amino acid N-acyltransferase YncA